MTMKVYRTIEEVEYNPNTVLTVGTFDGVHKGHLKIIRRLKQAGIEENLRHILITIAPHPQIVLKKEDRPKIKLLTSIEERLSRFRAVGIENTFVLPFTVEFSKTSPEDFVKLFLFEKIGMKKMLIGYDHLFGKNRQGNESLLESLSKVLGFSIEKIPPFSEGDEIISSTKIRNSILNRDLQKANEMLDYYYFLCGNVVRGDGRGRKLGIPTANIKSSETYKLMPADGAYFVYSIIEGKTVFGMANIGRRPTFTDDDHSTLEVNFFDFDDDIYDTTISVHFVKYIRPEKKFSGVEEFLKQLQSDKIICLEAINNFNI